MVEVVKVKKLFASTLLMVPQPITTYSVEPLKLEIEMITETNVFVLRPSRQLYSGETLIVETNAKDTSSNIRTFTNRHSAYVMDKTQLNEISLMQLSHHYNGQLIYSNQIPVTISHWHLLNDKTHIVLDHLNYYDALQLPKKYEYSNKGESIKEYISFNFWTKNNIHQYSDAIDNNLFFDSNNLNNYQFKNYYIKYFGKTLKPNFSIQNNQVKINDTFYIENNEVFIGTNNSGYVTNKILPLPNENNQKIITGITLELKQYYDFKINIEVINKFNNGLIGDSDSKYIRDDKIPIDYTHDKTFHFEHNVIPSIVNGNITIEELNKHEI